MKFFPPNIETSRNSRRSCSKTPAEEWYLLLLDASCNLHWKKSWLGCWDDHEAKLHGFTRHFAIVCSPCHYTMKDNNLEVIWGNQNYYKWTTDGNLQFQAIPVMAGGGRSHLLSSIPNWDETQKEPLLREAPWNHRSWRWNHPILRPNSDHPVTLKELGSAFLITGCTSSGHLWPGIRFWTFWEAYPRDHLVKPRRPLPDGKANKHEEIMLFHGL